MSRLGKEHAELSDSLLMTAQSHQDAAAEMEIVAECLAAMRSELKDLGSEGQP